MKKLFKLSITLFLVFFLIGCTGNTEKTDEEGNEKEVFSIGETGVVNNVKATVNSAAKIEKSCSFEWEGECESWNEPDNDYFLILNITIENNTDDDLALSSMASFTLKGDDAYTYDTSFYIDTEGSLDGTVLPNDKMRGEIVYDVKDLESYDLLFNPGLFDSPIKFVINKSDIE